MAEPLLFHHAHGMTAGVLSFADDIRSAGHIVHAPDLYDGKHLPGYKEGAAALLKHRVLSFLNGIAPTP